MGVSDRTATDGVLYDGWGAEGMRVLNSTHKFQQAAESLEMSHYDAVLLVAARAKENAYQTAEEQPGYIGSSFGGDNIGSGLKRPAPAKSQVITAIEELNSEFAESGQLPELVTPGIPEELLEMMAAESAAEASEALAAERAKEAEERLQEKLAARAASGAEADPAYPLPTARAKDEDEDDVEDEDEDSEDLLEALLGATNADEDDVVSLPDDDGDAGAEEQEESSNDFEDDIDLDDSALAELFGEIGGSGEESIEASGMSPGDGG